MDRHPRRDLAIPVVEHDPARIDVADETGHVVDLVHVTEEGVAHIAPSRERRLLVLDVQRGGREQVGVAEMIVVEVRDDQRFDRLWLDPQRPQAVRGRAEQPMATLRARSRVEPESTTIA